LSAPLPLLATINRGLARVPAVSLDPEEIQSFVCRREAVARVPGDHWRPSFEQLCADLEETAALSPLGRVMANGQLVGLLRARCRAERLLSLHPEIHAQPIERPIIIMGPMRSGSTRLQRLLACDDRLGWTRLYETLFPVPNGRGDPKRVAAAAAVHATLRTLNPAVQRIHPSGPLRPDEEFGFLSFSFHSAQFAVQWDVPRFVGQERNRDLLPVVRELSTLLKLNAWARREPARVSILKCPAYSGMAEAMLEVFPDARLICLSRDPAQVVASSASLVFEQRRIHSDTVDKSAVGPEWLTRTAERQRHLAKVRASNPEVPAFDLHYRAIGTDWRGTLHRLYRFLGLPLTAEVKGRMERFLSRAKAHRGHRYSLEDYGLTDEAVCQAFTPTAARTPYEAAAGAFLEEPASAFS
jgi:hypothetical protein